MANRFVLVAPGGPVTDLNHNVIPGLKYAQFQKTYEELYSTLQATGGCEAVFGFDDGSAPFRTRNKPMGPHAEETFFLQRNTNLIRITGALINLEPCYNHRYGNNHNCVDFFGPGGRTLSGQTRRFDPALPDTPVFFLESQPDPGQTSTISRTLARLSQAAARELVRRRNGAPWGEAVTPLGVVQKDAPKPWEIVGQEFMSAEEILGFLKQFRVPLENWMYRGCDDDIVEEVLSLAKK